MANDSGSSAVLGVIVGALLVGVVVLIFFGGVPWGNDSGADLEIKIDTPG